VDKDDWSGRVGLQYQLNDHQMVYVTASRGYKGPAFNTFFNMQAIDEIALKPETSTAFEAGVKGSILDGHVSGALAIYDEQFKNYQANFQDQTGTPPALVTRLINAGKVSSKGIEGDVSVRFTRDFKVDSAFTIEDAKVKHFNCPVGAPVSCDIDGQPLPFAPDFKAYVNGEYTVRTPVPGFDLVLQSDYSYQSKVQFSLAETPDTVQKAYGIWNASIALVGLENGWTIRGLVKNITDKHHAAGVAYGALAGVVRFVPRDDSRYGGVIVRKEF
jgi:iron complex outermembrane receptor protein